MKISKRDKIKEWAKNKPKELWKLFDSFKKKGEIYSYFEISDNASNVKFIQEIANQIKFDLDIYRTRRYPDKFCLHCGKKLEGFQTKFCCGSHAAIYNNARRDPEMYKELSKKLREKYIAEHPEKAESKEKSTKPKKASETPKVVKEKPKYYCEYCGKELDSKRKFCDNMCAAKWKHEDCYKDYLNHPEKYNRGNYTPKPFYGEFLKEQNGQCAICHCSPIHNGKPLRLVIDHINGDASDNRRENIRLVCPNCDSQLDTFKSKNKNSTRRNYFREKLLRKATQKLESDKDK